MTQKSFAEAMRALVLYTATGQEQVIVAEHAGSDDSSDAGRRENERALLATALEDANAIVGHMINDLMSSADELRNIYKVGLNTSRLLMVLFFFQAEDGIRDWSVTGVQTCALPIWHHGRAALAARPRARCALACDGVRIQDQLGSRPHDCRAGAARRVLFFWQRADRVGFAGHGGAAVRSEERRVGKECRAGWWAEP